MNGPIPDCGPQRGGAAMGARWLPLIQAGYYVLTGVWPFVSLRAFERVTGPKTDGWLVRTVGVLVAVIGVVIGLAGRRQAVTPEVRLLAAASAAGLALIDIVYVARRRIAPIYLLDAVLELALVGGWLVLRPPAGATRGLYNSSRDSAAAR